MVKPELEFWFNAKFAIKSFRQERASLINVVLQSAVICTGEKELRLLAEIAETLGTYQMKK